VALVAELLVLVALLPVVCFAFQFSLIAMLIILGLGALLGGLSGGAPGGASPPGMLPFTGHND
jgi:hypothetical protein